MARTNNTGIRFSDKIINDLDERRGDLTRVQIADEIMTKGLSAVSESAVEHESPLALDSTEKQSFFKHLTGGEGKEYQTELMSLELTEQELIDMAIAKSGKRYETLLKEALISHAKEQITQSARRDHKNVNSDGSPEKRLKEAFAELTTMMMEGGYRPRGGRLNISAVAQRARVNYNTAKQWALENQPEIL